MLNRQREALFSMSPPGPLPNFGHVLSELALPFMAVGGTFLSDESQRHRGGDCPFAIGNNSPRGQVSRRQIPFCYRRMRREPSSKSEKKSRLPKSIPASLER
jgi:hypothetical protein